MVASDYIPRLVEGLVESRLSAVGGVMIEGARAVGKTATGRHIAASEILMDIDPQVPAAMDVDPALLLRGDTPRLIDEWQTHPAIWNHVRREIDARRVPGQFILTGSAQPSDDITRHSGAGRITRVRLRPLTLVEKGESTGVISLASLLGGGQPEATEATIGVERVAELVSIGGWPGNLNLTVGQALDFNRGYLDEISRVDVRRLDGVRHDPSNVARLLRSLARNVATTAATATLTRDTSGPEPALDDDTVRSYLGRAAAADGVGGTAGLVDAPPIQGNTAQSGEAPFCRSVARRRRLGHQPGSTARGPRNAWTAVRVDGGPRPQGVCRPQ